MWILLSVHAKKKAPLLNETMTVISSNKLHGIYLLIHVDIADMAGTHIKTLFYAFFLS